MKKSELLRVFVVIILSAVLVTSLTTRVFADDNTDFGDWGSPVVTPGDNTGNTDNTNVENTNISNTNVNNTNVGGSGSTTTTLNTNVQNEANNTNTDEDKNSLAYTGVADNSALAVMIVLGVIATIYSAKKIREYNSL